jgi:hypothetical protein
MAQKHALDAGECGDLSARCGLYFFYRLVVGTSAKQQIFILF